MGALGEFLNSATESGDEGVGPELFGIPAVGPDVVDWWNGQDNDRDIIPDGQSPNETFDGFQDPPERPDGIGGVGRLEILTYIAVIAGVAYALGQLFTFEVGS